MGDLWLFNGTTTAVVGAALPVDTERINVAVNAIQLDQGMCAKIWELQLEGTGITDVMIQYSKDGVVWEDAKLFSKLAVAVPERLEKFNRPIVAAEAWNNTTWIRFINGAVCAAGVEFSVNIEFCEMKQA